MGVLLLAVVSVGGCGVDEPPVAAAPADCVDDWNDETRSLRFGRHVYESHASHQAQVTRMEAVDPNPNVPAGACAVIFAVADWDREYGYLGLVETDLGWASMEELARDDPDALDRIQVAAAESVNATLFPDGQLDAD